MATNNNVSVQDNNGGFLVTFILLVDPRLLVPSGNPFQMLWKSLCICSPPMKQ